MHLNDCIAWLDGTFEVAVKASYLAVWRKQHYIFVARSLNSIHVKVAARYSTGQAM